MRTITVPITDDALAEGPESLQVSLDAVSGLRLADNVGRGWITPNDGGTGAVPAARRVAIDDVRVAEGAGAASVTVRIDQPVNATLRLSTAAGTATAGSDYTTITNQLVTFTADGPTAVTVDVPVTGDSLRELQESFTVTLTPGSTVTAADSSATVSIDDDDGDLGQVSISDATAREGNEAAFLITLDGSVDRDLTVTISLTNGTATIGSDLGSPSSLALTFPAGSSNVSKVITVPIVADGAVEPPESFGVRIALPPDAPAMLSDSGGTGTIMD